MADVSVNIGVSGISQFKQGMSEAKESIKTLDAALKANEKAVKATGDAEGHLAAQTTLLNAKIQQQKNIIKNAEQALKQMSENGVRESSREFQKMQRTLIEAQSGLMDTEQQLDQLGAKETETAEKTDKLASSLGGLNKKVSLEQVTSAIDKITGGMEKAAAKAIDFGKQLWDTIMDSAKRADDTATMAEMYGIDLQEFKKMQKLVGEGMDTTVESMLTAQDKLNKGIGKGTKEVKERLEELGISLQTWATVQGQSGSSLITRDAIDVFWGKQDRPSWRWATPTTRKPRHRRCSGEAGKSWCRCSTNTTARRNTNRPWKAWTFPAKKRRGTWRNCTTR